MRKPASVAPAPAPPPADAPPSPPPSPDVERALALMYVLNGRLVELEHSNTELRAALGLAPLALPAIDTSTWCSIKEAAHRAGFSESYIRKLAAAGRLRSLRAGGRVLVDAGSVPALKRSP